MVTRRFEYPLPRCSLTATSKPEWLHLSFSAGMLPFAHFTCKMCLWHCFWLQWDHFGFQVQPSGVQMSSKSSTMYLCLHWVLLHHTQKGPDFLHTQQNHSTCVMNTKTMVEYVNPFHFIFLYGPTPYSFLYCTAVFPISVSLLITSNLIKIFIKPEHTCDAIRIHLHL